MCRVCGECRCAALAWGCSNRRLGGQRMKGRGEPKKQAQQKKATKSIKEKRREKKEKKAGR